MAEMYKMAETLGLENSDVKDVEAETEDTPILEIEESDESDNESEPEEGSVLTYQQTLENVFCRTGRY